MQGLHNPLVVDADRFATAWHASIGQLQPYTQQPYSAHFRAVAKVLSRFIAEPESLAAAMAHDVVADTPATVAMVLERLGPVVALTVDELTEKSGGLPTRRERVAFEVQRLADVSVRAKNVKCADVDVNLATIVERAPTFARVYVPEKRLLLPSLIGAADDLLELATLAVERAEAKLQALPRDTSKRRQRALRA